MTWNLARRWAPAVAVALALFAPRLASAQNMSTSGGTIPITLPANATYVNLSLYDCLHNAATQVTFEWTYTYTATQSFEYILSPSNNCDPPTGSSLGVDTTTESDSSANVEYVPMRLSSDSSGTTSAGGNDDINTNLTFGGIWDFAQQSVNTSVQVAYNAAPTSLTCPNTISTVTYLCVLLEDSSVSTTGSATLTSGWISFVLQSEPPAAPTTPTATPLDSAIKVDWTAVTTPESAFGYIAYAQDPVSGDVVNSVSTSGGTEVTITRLKNGVTYNVYVVSIDNAGSNPPATANQSPPSTVVTATPVQSVSFFEQYKDDGGKETGCSSTGGASLALLLPILVFLRRKKRPGANGLVLVASMLLISLSSASAFADDKDSDEAPPPGTVTGHQFSSEWFRVDILTGLFTPNPDTEPGLTGSPYAQMFTQKNPFLTRAQLHVNFWSKEGHLSLGLSAGIWAISGHALLEDHVTQSGDTETLTLYPFTPILGYRMDFIYTRFGVPVIPFVKVGYGLVYFLDTKNGLVTTGTTNGKTWHSYGLASGVEGAGGIEFPLDFLDPRRAANLDEDFGINSTGIFFEYGYNDWVGLNGGLRLNASSYSGGLYVAF